MRSLLYSVIFMLIFLFAACSSNSNNPVAPSNTLKGTWKLTYYGTEGDTLHVTLNIDGSDNKLGGSGSLDYIMRNNGRTFTLNTTDNLSGSYSTTSIDGSLGTDFKFTGTKSGSNYAGTFWLNRVTDTLSVSGVTYVASN